MIFPSSSFARLFNSSTNAFSFNSDVKLDNSTLSQSRFNTQTSLPSTILHDDSDHTTLGSNGPNLNTNKNIHMFKSATSNCLEQSSISSIKTIDPVILTK